jgi:two-component system, cell cycle sensor histidine kinase and response regulator CckA
MTADRHFGPVTRAEMPPGTLPVETWLQALPGEAALIAEGGVVVAWNAAWAAMFGAPSADSRGARRLVLPGLPREFVRAVHDCVDRVLGGALEGHTCDLSAAPFAPPSASDAEQHKWESLSASALEVDGRRHALVLLRPALPAHQASEALRESEGRFRQLAESVDDVFWLTTPEKDRVLYVSPAYERIWGRSCADLYAKPRTWLEAIHAEDRPRVLAAALAKQATGAYDEEYRILDAQGRVRWIRDRAFPVRDEAGRVYRIAGVAEDITAYKGAVEAARGSEDRYRRLHDDLESRVVQRTAQLQEANEALRLAERRLRQVIDLVPHFVFAKDADGRFLFVNQAVADAYGTTVESLRGRTDADFAQSADEVRHFRADDLEVLRSGRPKVVPEETITDAAGRTRILQTVKIPFTYSGTGVPALLGVAIDITERKRLEQQLLQSQKMEGLGRLAGGIAHDFNNLLTVVVGCAQLLEAPALSTEQQHHVDRIRDAADRAAALTSQLLTFARGQVTSTRVVDLNVLVLDIEKLLRRVLGDDVTLATQTAPNLGFVEVDAGQLEQVLLNLAVNARDAMPHGGRLTLATRNVGVEEARRRGGPFAPASDCVEVTVTDTGTGMGPETMARLFEPFFTTKPGAQGTGLGLATCYGIVKRFQGHIWAESALGTGTTFHILLARSTKTLASDAAARPTIPSGTAGGETVLVVEDHAAVRDVTVRALARQGYEVLPAAAPEEALALSQANAGRIHLVVTDVVMPGMSGPEMVGRLLAKRPQMRVLYVSGYSQDALRRGAPGAEHDLLQKPFTPDLLARKVREILDRTA